MEKITIKQKERQGSEGRKITSDVERHRMEASYNASKTI